MDGGYHKLEIYNKAHVLGVRIHETSLTLPKFELYEEGSQIRRSSKSVSNNIVEGFALRKYESEFIHYLYRAYASSEETLEHLRCLHDTKSLIDEKLFDELKEEILTLNGKLFRFIQSVEKEHDVPAFLREPETEYHPEP